MSKPDQFSHSQINSWLRCGKAYQLERLIGAPTPPAVYLVVGNAMHTAIEEINKQVFAAQVRRVAAESNMQASTVSA